MENLRNILLSLKLIKKDDIIKKYGKDMRKYALFALECFSSMNVLEVKEFFFPSIDRIVWKKIYILLNFLKSIQNNKTIELNGIESLCNSLLILKLIGDDISKLTKIDNIFKYFNDNYIENSKR